MSTLMTNSEIYMSGDFQVLGVNTEKGLSLINSEQKIEYIVNVTEPNVSEAKIKKIDIYSILKGLPKHLKSVKIITDQAINSAYLSEILKDCTTA